MKSLTTLLCALVLGATTWALLPQGSYSAKKVTPEAALIEAQLPSYPLETCLVSDEPLDAMGKPHDLIHEGRLVRLCCKGCVKGFQKDPAKSLAKLDEAIVAAQVEGYPMDTCIVSKEGLHDMGEPIDMVHGTRLVRLCCKGCVKGFQRKPEEFMAKIDAALIEKQKASYPMDSCVVSGEPLEDPVDNLYGTRLVRFCCKGCVKAFKKDPKGFLAKLDEKAGKKQAPARKG